MAIECLGRSRGKHRRVDYLHQPLAMRMVPGRDAYKCLVCGYTVDGKQIAVGKGENEYWQAGKDHRSAGTNLGPGNPSGTTYNARTGVYSVNFANSGTSWSLSNLYSATNSSVTATPITMQHLSSAFKSVVSGYDYKVSHDLPVEQQAEPIVAWRLAKKVRVERGLVLFSSLHYGDYTADDRAVCYTGRAHHWSEIPVVNCSCGFYGMADVNNQEIQWELINRVNWDPDYEYGNPVLLEVEFYGRVIKCEFGYRAQFQRIKNVYSYEKRELPGFNVRDLSEIYPKMMLDYGVYDEDPF